MRRRESGNRAVFLDRDGILNRAVLRNGRPHPPQSLDEFEILDEARQACALWRDNGFSLICVTNQPDIARGTQRFETVNVFNALLREALRLNDVFVCPHDDKDACACRKPKPGLILEAARVNNIDLTRSFMVGDMWRDVAAGRAADCQTVFIDRGYDVQRPEAPDFTTMSVIEAAKWILSTSQDRN